MNSMISWVFTLLAVIFITNASAKPIQSETPETSAVRRMDSLAGYSFGTNKATRSVNDLNRSLLDSLGNANYLRSLDSIGGNNYLRSLDSLNEANFLKDLDSVSVAKLNRALETLGAGGGNYIRHQPSDTIDFRTLDTLGGSNLLRGISKQATGGGSGHSDGKRLDTLSGLTLGHQKRTFDEVDRTAFDGFNKRNFDEIDRVGFDGFTKRNARSVPSSSSS